MQFRYRQPHKSLPGFTLIEMMIVILIISLLLAIIVPVGASVLGLSRDAATKTTIKKVHELLNKRLEAFNRDFPGEFKRTYGREFRPANPSDLMYRKRRFYQLFFGNANIAVNGKADSAEVLYAILTRTESYGTVAESSTEFTSAEVGDTDGDGRMEFLDSWGEPLRYYLYPTRLFKPDGHIANVTNNGVDLNQGTRAMFSTPLSAGQLNFDKDDQFGVLTQNDVNEQNYHTFQTHHVPLVVSSGPDKTLGLYEPYDRPNYGHLAKAKPDLTAIDDDISNHNTQGGAD